MRRLSRLIASVGFLLLGPFNVALSQTTLPPPPPPPTCDVSWKAAVSGSWHNHLLWSTGTVPTSTQSVCIEAVGADYRVSVGPSTYPDPGHLPEFANLKINSSNATVDVVNFPLFVDGSSRSLQIQAGTLTGLATYVRLGAAFHFEGGTIDADVVVIHGSLNLVHGGGRGRVVMRGVSTLSGSAIRSELSIALEANGPTPSVITAADSFQNTGRIELFHNTELVVTGRLRNNQTGNVVFAEGNTTLKGYVDNFGHVFVKGGEARIISGYFTNWPQSSIEFENDARLVFYGYLSNYGAIRIGDPGRTQVLEIRNGSVLKWGGGWVDHVDPDGPSGVFVVDGTLDITASSGGWFGVPGDVFLRGKSTLRGDVPLGTNVFVDTRTGPATVSATKGFKNEGTIRVGGGGQAALLEVQSGSLLNSGRLDLASGATVTGSLVNDGELRVSGAARLAKGDGSYPAGIYTNNGKLLLGDASAPANLVVEGVSFKNGRPCGTACPDGAGGIIEGWGTIDVTTVAFQNAGTIRPGPGIRTLTFTGDVDLDGSDGYLEGPTGDIQVEIGGSSGIQSSSIDVSGAVRLGGRLVATLSAGYVPAYGDAFSILTYGSSTYRFEGFELPALPGGLVWAVDIGSTATVLRVLYPLTVTSTGNASDAKVGDGVCSTTNPPPANWGRNECTLHAAIQEANATAAFDRIGFWIPGTGPHTIQPASPLPTITSPVLIDGYTQPGASPNTNGPGLGSNAVLMIEIDGTGIGTDPDGGLVIQTDSSTVRGLAINRLQGGGDGIVIRGGTGNRIQGNFLGTDVTGTQALGNFYGVALTGSAQSNVIGTDGDGVDDPAERNVLSGNRQGGAIAQRGRVIDETDANVIAGNLIGTNAAGTAALPNRYGVVIINGPKFNRIGTNGDGMADALERNVISGNTEYGVLFTDPLVGGTAHNLVAGNYIGTDVTGTQALGNGTGVRIAGGLDNTVGGTTAAMRNVISGNTLAGVILNLPATTGNVVQGNFIGTTADGTAAIPNVGYGIEVGNASSNTIGGTVPGSANVISGNGVGIALLPEASGMAVLGNLIGTNGTGSAVLANATEGIVVRGSQNRIGGAGPGEGNVIAAHPGSAVLVEWAGSASPMPDGNVIQGNRIGAPAPGTPDEITGAGIRIRNAIRTVIGGDTRGTENVITGNGSAGVVVAGAASSGNQIASNSIYDNGGLGIDLVSSSLGPVTPNDVQDPDTGPNELQNFPEILGYNSFTNEVSGTFNSTPNSFFKLQFFTNTTCDGTGFGEGQVPRDTASVGTDGAGDARFNVKLSAAVDPRAYLSATATSRTTGSTSEFSRCVAAGYTIVSGDLEVTDTFIPIGPSFTPGFTLTAGTTSTSTTTVSICSTTTSALTAGDWIAVGCGSAHIKVLAGTIEILVDEYTEAVVPKDATVTVNEVAAGTITVENKSAPGVEPVKIVVDGAVVGEVVAGKTLAQATLQVVKAELKADAHFIEVAGALAVSPGGQFDPLTEPVVATLGPLAIAVPAGSFKPDDGGFKYEGDQSVGEVEMVVGPDGSFVLEVRDVDLDAFTLPARVSFSLGIGDDLASVAIPFDARGEFFGTAASAVRLAGTFDLRASPDTFIVRPGAPAHYAVEFGARSSFTGKSVTLSCVDLPEGASCVFDPPVLTPGASGATAHLTVTTDGSGQTLYRKSGFGAVSLAMMFLALVMGGRGRDRQGGRRRVLVIGLVFAATGLFSACGNDVLLGPTGVRMTTPGTHTFKVVATAASETRVVQVTMRVGE